MTSEAYKTLQKLVGGVWEIQERLENLEIDLANALSELSEGIEELESEGKLNGKD